MVRIDGDYGREAARPELALIGDACATDPVCELSPLHAVIGELISANHTGEFAVDQRGTGASLDGDACS